MTSPTKNRRLSTGISERQWYHDLCEYYGVTPEKALALGMRSKGRRPDLPGSRTTHSVSGMTLAEIWALRDRNTVENIHSFYKEMGAWSTFRQVVYHRHHHFDNIAKTVSNGTSLCEYGAGVAPVCWWLVEHLRNTRFDLTIADVPSEHFTFGHWRLQRRIEELGRSVSLDVREVSPTQLPLKGTFDIITILEVYEHLYNPLDVTVHLCEHLRSGGLLWENYILKEESFVADLEVAQVQRSKVFKYLRHYCQLIKGRDPYASDGGGTRCWQRL